MITSVHSFYSTLSAYQEKELNYGVKSLNQQERKFVLSCIGKIKDTGQLFTADFKTEKELASAERIIGKISLHAEKCMGKKSNLFVRIWKGFLNALNLRISSKRIVEKVHGKRMTQKALVSSLKKLEASRKKEPGQKIDLGEFFQSKGYSTRLRNLNLAVEKLAVLPQTRLPFGKAPSWGSDLFRNVALADTTLEKCTLEWIDFSRSTFDNVTFENCNLDYAVMKGAKFRNCRFINCTFNSACFEEAVLEKTTFKNSKLQHSTFHQAQLGAVSMRDCDLTGAVFLGAEVADSCRLTKCVLDNTYLFATETKFQIIDGKSPELCKPLLGILWNHHKVGIAGNKIHKSIIRNGGVPFKVHYEKGVDQDKLDQEVKDLLKDLVKKADASIPQQLLEKAKSNPALYPETCKVIRHAEETVKHMGGLVLPGGDTDIPPEFYGQKTDPKTQPDKGYLRIVFEFAAIQKAAHTGLPLMGICRGCQLVNVFHGGDLKQHVTWQDGVQIYNAKSDKSSGILASILKKGHIRAFTNHHQANSAIAEGALELVAENSVPKALESKHGSPVLLTQFHPEFGGDDSNLMGFFLDLLLTNNNEEIFSAFADCAYTHHKKKQMLPQIQAQKL